MKKCWYVYLKGKYHRIIRLDFYNLQEMFLVINDTIALYYYVNESMRQKVAAIK